MQKGPENARRGVVEKFFSKIEKRAEEKTREQVVKIFWDIDPQKVKEWMNQAPDSPPPGISLSRKQVLIRAVLEGLGPEVIGKYQEHPQRIVREVAELLAWGQLGEAIAIGLNKKFSNQTAT